MGDVLSGGSSRSATAEELESYEQMRQSLSQLPVPTLQRRNNPHEYLFFALFDGTGQDANNPDGGPLTNVGVLNEQAQILEENPSNRISVHYVEGIGTQDNPITRIGDKAFAHTWDERIERMYREFAEQAAEWQRDDPQAQISVAGVGYSRGGVLVPGFARLVDQYGIVDPDDLTFGRDQHGNITIESSRPPLVPPGHVAQAVGLFDPVATNFPKHYDARLPPSVISGFSMLAKDEQRQLFPHQTIIGQTMTADGRFLGVTVPGGHSNVGGGGEKNGLEIMAGNGMIDYLNRLSDRPLFEKRTVPADPAMFTVYQAQGVTAGFGTRMDRDGQRDLREALANCKIVDPCRDSEPMDRALAGKFERRLGAVDPVEQAQLQTLIEQAPGRTQDTPRIGDRPLEPQRQTFKPTGDPLIDRYFDAAQAGDRDGVRSALIAFKESDRGQQLMAQARELVRDEREQQPGRDNPLFAQALREVEKLGPQAGGYRNQEELERVAGTIALQAKLHYLPSIDAVLPGRDGRSLFATWTNPGNDVVVSRALVDKTQAAAQPLDQNLQQLTAETQRQEEHALIQAQQQQLNAQQSPGMSR